jgi:sugar/nucleoside kinase (ribokinase family)
MPGPILDPPAARTFDVLCAGEALWSLSAPGGALEARSTSLHLRPGGGALNAALALARLGLRVGLATALGDDTFGRALCGRIAAAGVDVGGVVFGPPRTGLVFVQGSGEARQVVSFREDEQPLTVPAAWAGQVLLLSGLSPVVSHGAALVKAARAARRVGSMVVIDANARRHAWAGRDPRAIRTVLREADVVRCSAEDLAVLGLDPAGVRAALRKGAVLVVSLGAGEAWASGPFGEVAAPAEKPGLVRAPGAGDRFTAGLCADLARAGSLGEDRPERWQRTLARAQAASAKSPRR